MFVTIRFDSFVGSLGAVSPDKVKGQSTTDNPLIDDTVDVCLYPLVVYLLPLYVSMTTITCHVVVKE